MKSKRIIFLVAVTLLVFVSPVAIRAQRGLYLTLDVGMAFRDLKPTQSLRGSGELKWMFLPYLGASIDVGMQRPSNDPNIVPLSAMAAFDYDTSNLPSWYYVLEITRSYSFNLIFQPIAIANKETPHIFAIAVGCGLGVGYKQDWDVDIVKSVLTPWYKTSSDYSYDHFHTWLANVNFQYAYQVYGPLFLGAHVGFTTTENLYFFYIYGGATVGLRFGNLSSKVKTE